MIQSKLSALARYPYIWPTFTPHLLLSPLALDPSPHSGPPAPPMVAMVSRNTDLTGSESHDPDIRMAYRSIAQEGTLNWLLLSYGKWSPGLKLVAAGSQGLSELKQHMAQSEQSVFFAFVRVPVDAISHFATITYIPESTSGLRKARTSVASRTVQAWFKAPQATLTVARLEDINTAAILEAMPSSPIRIVRAPSEPQNREKDLPRAPGPVARTASEPMNYVSLRGPPNFGDPRTRKLQRDAARRAAELEDREARHEEEVRQARIKLQREKEARMAEEEERTRRAQLEHDLERIAAARAAREEEERTAEERRVQDRADRRRRDAEKRAEEAQRLEEWRLEEVRRLEELARAEEELKRKAMERREAARAAAHKRRRESRMTGDSMMLTGWVTVQSAQSVSWKRRYFQLTDTLMRFYKSDKDVGNVPLDVVVLKDASPSTKEWHEGFEELRSIPHSFALVFGNGEQSMMLFSDSVEEKVCAPLLGRKTRITSLAPGRTFRSLVDMSMMAHLSLLGSLDPLEVLGSPSCM
ncbi:hypothetical protein BC834DRAFT_857554 [Gloeopeniophorella convolvens]|nr:hypothetical protein BC834DRAFT_857554 [Gloeopeniophorella convolvens]